MKNIINGIKCKLYGKKIEKKEADIAYYKEQEEKCKESEQAMYDLVYEKMDFNDNVDFIDKYCHAKMKDYYRDKRFNLESNMVTRSKEEDINVKYNYFLIGMYTAVGLNALGIWLKNRK